MHKMFERVGAYWAPSIPVVPISNCVHYCAFRYGRHDYNPYETYLLQIADGAQPELARGRFTEFLRHYRPRHLGEALGCGESLTKQYTMWDFPWNKTRPAEFDSGGGWRDYPNDCPDILTHFSARGILRQRIEEEFFWLERALVSIRTRGYQPVRHRSFVRAVTLRRSDGTEAHLLTDGNHRVAAMSALGYKSVRIYRPATKVIFETECDRWPGVGSKRFAREDALRVFHAYFEGNFDYQTVSSPANLITTCESKTDPSSAAMSNSNYSRV